ncbi:sensor histidine kinase [Microvirga flavescens]|uniref:sensor histidine kinase n=1 Tax=Microvirga flavescens TaxID=2249811 RepID=UPI000DD7CC85|nr:ATP-binding protein [Microvirga flavescens]
MSSSVRAKLRSYKSAILSLVAIATLTICFALTVARLLHVESDLRSEDTHTNLWQITQTQFEATLLAESLSRAAGGEVFYDPEQAPKFRLAILISRLSVLLEGPQAELVARLGELGDLKASYLQLTLAETLFEAETNIDREAALHVRGQAREVAYFLRDIANKVMLYNRQQGSDTRSKYLRVVFESMLFIVGIFLSASFLMLRLYKGLGEATQAKRLLRQEQEFSDLVINNISNQGIVIFNEDLNCLLWNPGMEILLNLDATDVVDRPLREAVPLFSREEVGAALAQAIMGTTSVIEDEGISPDGRERCLEIHCFPLDMAERSLGIAFLRDITESWQARKQAEQQNVDLEIKVQQRTAALRQAERRLIAAIDSAPEGFAAFDNAGRLLYANERIRAAEPVNLWCREEITLTTFLKCFSMCEGADPQLLTAGEAFAEFSVDLRINKSEWAQLSVTRADGGTIFVRLTDISGYKHAATALQSALDRERETTSAYRSFVSMVSHQFRTPLAILDSSAQRLIRRGTNVTHDEIVTRAQRIRNATGRLTSLVESVLNAARLDAGRIELNLAWCSLVDLVWDICERHKELSPHAEIDFEVPEQPIKVHCDSILIEQVVINLLSNAIKYSGEKPRIKIKLWVDDGQAFCSIADSGIGIPPDELSKIFERFYRARTASGIAGTGIGLNFAQKIMHLHGGQIQVESYEAVGSVFTFDLPISSVDQAPKAA